MQVSNKILQENNFYFWSALIRPNMKAFSCKECDMYLLLHEKIKLRT